MPINDNEYKASENEYIIIAIDDTEIKVTNRGQWMREKWNLKNKKGYLAIQYLSKANSG